MKQDRNPLLIPPLWFLLGIILTGTAYFALPSLNVIPLGFNFTGIVLIVPGILLNLAAAEAFRKKATPHDFHKPQKIVDEGVMELSRNPMYLGMILILLGVAVCFGNIAGFVVPVLFFFGAEFFFIPSEDKMMKNIFGQAWIDYKGRVRKWL
jgi:protein-S-isoprenylcysteine O-methyltransferase Ste14